MKDKLSLVAFMGACIAAVYLFGIFTARYQWPPYRYINSAITEVKTALLYHKDRLSWQYFQYDDAPDTPDVVHDLNARAPGATLVSGFTEDQDVHKIRIVDVQGDVIQEWALNWDELWPGEAPHIPEPILNRKQHHPHGVALLENGDIVFNFTELATLRVNPCGEVIWRLDRRGHHSIDISPDGSFWIPGLITHYEPVDRFPNHSPPFEEFWALHVSADGEVIDEFSLNQALIDNGYVGLLYGSTLNEFTPIVKKDTLHVNDIEVFRTDMEEGVAKHGDILVSLRNINAIALMDPKDRRIKFISIGKVMRQHDADFIDGNTISVFNNNNLLPEWLDNASGQRGIQNQSSSVDTISLISGDILQSVADSGGEPFFTDVMGMHQRLDNGNLLIAEARAGRVLERSPDGRTVWEYYNVLDDTLLGAVTYAERLDPVFDAQFFEAARAGCSS